MQYAETNDDTSPGQSAEKFIRQVLGIFQNYGKVMDSTMLVALRTLVAEKAAPTTYMLDKIQHFLDYCTMQKSSLTKVMT